ncbi:MAG: FtsH-binding integral membrane protein [Lentimonas sp.]|jgi:FtsH-binding integral membrane protein
MYQETTHPFVVAQAGGDVKANFIRKTYMHLAGAVLAFIGLEIALFSSPLAAKIASLVLNSGSIGWLGFLGVFIIAGWLARSMAVSGSKTTQYAGLGFYVVAEALIFVPILYLAVYYSSPQVLTNAVIMTLTLFAGLTATVFITRTDFSFLKTALTVGGFIAIGAIVCGALFGFNLGMWFSVAMIVFACGAILYDTSNILHHYQEDQYVGASLQLFASVALLFWYVLRLFMSRD